MISYNEGNASQTIENFKKLLPRLIDPLTHEKLVCKKSDDMRIQLISEKSKNIFPVRRNIPCFLSSSLNLISFRNETGKEKLWNELQESEFKASQEEPTLSFSVDENYSSNEVSDFIKKSLFDGTCLDIGCGVMPVPSYMKGTSSVEFMGIDPYFGDYERKFPFVQGISELLPFEDNCFNGILFATSLDHVLNPIKTLEESFRVLKNQGIIFIWYFDRKIDFRYIFWKMGIRKKVDIHHIWCFRDASLMRLVEKAGFRNISIERFKNHPRNRMLMARKLQ